MDQSEQRAGWQEQPPTSRRRGWITSGALVGTGLLAGAILAGTLSANAAGGGGSSSALAAPAAATSTEATPSEPDDPDSDGPGHDWRDWWHGDDDAQISDDAAAKVKDAVLAQYPDATIWWIRSDSDGGYDAYIDTADGKDLAVHLDDAFAVTGTDDLPDADGWWGHGGNFVADETADKVKDAVLAQYPEATVPWIWADTDDGGYHAFVMTADDEGVVVHLDDSFAITEIESMPGC
jgi:hypothetical protein